MKNLYAAYVLIALVLISPTALAYTDVGIDVQTRVSSTCPCTTLTGEDINVIIKNLGTSRETYQLSLALPDDETWSGFISPTITLSPDEEGSVGAFFLTPSCSVDPGTYSVGVMVNSTSSGKGYLKEFEVGVLTCHGIEIEAEEFKLCQGIESVLSINVSNTGMGDERIKLTASESWIGFPAKTIDIDKGEEIEVSVLFSPPGDESGKKIFTVTAESTTSYASAEETYTADVRVCYSSVASIEPERIVVCPCETAEFVLSIYNTGLMVDTFVVSFNDGSSEMTIWPGEKDELKVPIDIPCDMEEGEYTVVVSIESMTSGTAEAAIDVLSSSECYSVSLTTGNDMETVEVGKAVTYTITISNDGRFDQEYELLIDAPDWIHLSKKQVALGPGEGKDVYLYAAPNYYIAAGNYSAALSAMSETEQAGLEFKVNVNSDFSIEEAIPPDVEEPLTDNKTEAVVIPPDSDTGQEDQVREGDGNITMNISIPTGGLIAGDAEEQDRPWNQIMLLTILAIGVVVILILRFVIMIK